MGTDGFWEGDWGWSSHFWKKLSFSIGRDVFRVDVGLGVVGQEAGTRDVLAFLVRPEAVGGLDVVAHGTEDFLVEVGVCADGDDPFDAVAGGACEKEGRGEFPVTEEHFTVHRHVGDVVEVQAEEVRGELDVGVAAGGEGAPEGDVVEVLSLVTGGLGLVRDGAEAFGLLLCVVAREIAVDFNEGNVLEGHCVADGPLEEGNVGRKGQPLDGFLGMGEPGHHYLALRWLKSSRALSASTTIFLPFWLTASRMTWSL